MIATYDFYCLFVESYFKYSKIYASFIDRGEI